MAQRRHWVKRYRVPRRHYVDKQGRGRYRKAYVVKGHYIRISHKKFPPKPLYIPKRALLYLIVRSSFYLEDKSKPKRNLIYKQEQIAFNHYRRVTFNGQRQVRTDRVYIELRTLISSKEINAIARPIFEQFVAEFESQSKYTTMAGSVQLVQGIILQPFYGLVEGQAGHAIYFDPVKKTTIGGKPKTENVLHTDLLQRMLALEIRVNRAGLDLEYFGKAKGDHTKGELQ